MFPPCVLLQSTSEPPVKTTPLLPPSPSSEGPILLAELLTLLALTQLYTSSPSLLLRMRRT